MKTKSTLLAIMFFVCTSLSVTTYAQAVNVQDSLALVALYNSTNGPNWQIQTNWLTGPVSTWLGITVADSRVTGINLHSNKLTGSLPPEIGNLVNLTSIFLFSNQLGSLPPEFGNLVNLTPSLDLSKNQLTSIPGEIGNLVNLTSYLDLSNNQLTTIPGEIGNLVNLTFLYLQSNNLSSLPSEIGNLSELTYLSLSGAKLSSLPPQICNLSKLTFLNLSGTELSSLPPEIGNLTALGNLKLGNNKFTSLPPEIGKLINLFDLDLFNNQLSSLPVEIGNLVNLTTLSLTLNQLTSLPPEIGNLVNLTYLGLGYNKLSSIPPEIGNLLNLTYLNLQSNNLSSIPSEIGNLVNLYYLDLSYNHLTFDGLEIVVQQFPFAGYYYQANIPLHQNGNSLFVSAGGTLSNNTYNWYKVEDGNIATIVGDSVFHPSSSGRYYARVYNTICYLTLNTDTIEYDATLPVTIINLKAQQQGGIVKVDWSSLTEINMQRYEVQRSANANTFSSIGSIPATKNGTAQQNYSFNDMQPLKGNNYYRLKAIDKNGSITYSKIVLVTISGREKFTIVYPVPAKNILYIQTNGSATFSLVSQAGNILLTTNINGNGSMNVGGFAAGLYYLKNNSTGAVQKVVITK